jgi:hypothetical protein
MQQRKNRSGEAMFNLFIVRTPPRLRWMNRFSCCQRFSFIQRVDFELFSSGMIDP